MTAFSAYAFQAMGCPCELRLYGASQAELAGVTEELLAEVRRFEHRYSRYREDSLVSEINANAGGLPVAVDEEAGAIFDYADACFRESSGLFDVTSGVYRHVWHTGIVALPRQSDIEAIRSRVGWGKVRWTGGSIQLTRDGMEIDLGGIVKEYVADTLAGRALQLGVRHGLIDLGGDLRVIGPHPDGQPWQVGITNPADRGGAIAVTQLLSGGVATSGSYERMFEIEGRRFSHIINPLTGWPVEGLVSVSVIAAQTLVAGSLSTIAMLHDEQSAIDWLHSLEVPFVAVTRDLRCIRGRSLQSNGLKRVQDPL